MGSIFKDKQQEEDENLDQFRIMLFRIEALIGDSSMVERLLEIGFKEGKIIEYFSRAPFSGPSIFRIDATMIALREEEKKCLVLSKI